MDTYALDQLNSAKETLEIKFLQLPFRRQYRTHQFYLQLRRLRSELLNPKFGSQNSAFFVIKKPQLL